jgi:hypothetical protein
MGKYRARHCPKCNYYVGFSIAKPRFKAKETSITSFCLNCSYKLPIDRIIRGIRRTTAPFRRGALRLAAVTGVKTHDVETRHQPETAEKPSSLMDYPRHLRVIGQDLEPLRLKAFNLECTGDAYLVWSRSDIEVDPLSCLSRNRLQKLWRKHTQPRPHGREERFILPSSLLTKRYRYSAADLNRMEQEAKSRRRQKGVVADGHSLSQLLRTLGAVVSQNRERLLGISWQDFSVSVVVENAQGQREIDVFRHDNLYDIWVRMYLRRENRALSDFPR